MTSIQRVLQHVFVARFYQVNLGFFLFFFLLFFGIFEPAKSIRFHYALMQMMAQQIQYLLLGFAIWTLYYIKCVSYCLKAVNDPANTFLFELQAQASVRQKRNFAYSITAIFAPATLYALFTAGAAVTMHCYVSVLLILAYLSGMLAAAVAICRRPILYAAKEKRSNLLSRMMERFRPRSVLFYQYLTAYLMARRKMLLLMLKSGSLVILQQMVVMNKEDVHFEGTYVSLLLLVMAHALIPYYLVRFTEGNAWLRNLPLGWLKRYGCYALSYAVLFLPELLFLLIHTHTSLSIPAICSLYVLAVSMLCWMSTMLYLPNTGVERYTLILFVALPLTLVMLPAVNIWWLSAFWWLSSMLLFPVLHRRYEVVME